MNDDCGFALIWCFRPEHEEIEKIVEEVMNLLGHNQIWSFSGDLVDMDSRVKQLEELLDLSANDVVRVVGICDLFFILLFDFIGFVFDLIGFA